MSIHGNKIKTFFKKEEEETLELSFCVAQRRRHRSIYPRVRMKSFTTNGICWQLDFGLPSPRTVGN
jgi:hypothetical protein